MFYSRLFVDVHLTYRTAVFLIIGLITLIFSSTVYGQEMSDSVSTTSAEYKKASKHANHVVSIGAEKGTAAPALTNTWLVKMGNEKFGYLSSGYRSIAKSTRGFTIRYDRSFQVFKPFSESVNIQPCIIAAVNYNQATTQTPRSFLFFPSDVEYSVGEHRSISFGAGIETRNFVRIFRAGMRLGFLYSHVLDDFEVVHKSGEYLESFKESIIRRAQTPFQIVFSINVMVGKPDKRG